VDTLESTPQPTITEFDSNQALLPLGPNNPPWNSLMAVGLWLLSIALIAFIPAIFLLPYLASSGILKGGGERVAEFSTNDPTAIIIQMLAVIPAHLLTFLAAWLIVTNFRKYSFFEMLGFRSGGIRWWHYVILMVVFFGLAAAVTQFYPQGENQFLRILESSRTVVFVVAFMATFTAPIVEELVYRGVVYSAFQRTFGVTAAVIVVSLMFTSVHVLQYLESPSTIALILVLSIILTLLRSISGNLLPSIIFHTLINGIQSIGLIVEPYLKDHTPAEAVAILLQIK